MWEVIFLWMKKYGKSLPLWVLILVLSAFMSSIVFVVLHPKPVIQKKEESIIEPELVPDVKQTPRNNQNPIEEIHTVENSPKEGSNFSQFSLGLQKKLELDHLDPAIGTRLSERIYEGLKRDGDFGLDQLRVSIREELGPRAAEQEVDRVHKAVIDQLNEISKSPGPKPSLSE